MDINNLHRSYTMLSKCVPREEHEAKTDKHWWLC